MSPRVQSAVMVLSPVAVFGSVLIVARELPLAAGALLVLSVWSGMLAMHMHGRALEMRRHVRWLDRTLAERYGFRSSE